MKRTIFEAKTRIVMRRDRRALREMLAAERLPPQDLRALSDRRSVEIALHAFRTTAFYREHYTRAGFTESDIARAENFAHLPLLTKADLQGAGDGLVSSGSRASDRLPSRTGGSTGRPLKVYNDRSAPVAALWWRIYSWWGIHPADDAAFIYRQKRRGLKKLMYDLEWWPTRHVLLDARGTTARDIEAFEAQVLRVRPRLLVGYVEGVDDFASHVARAHVDLPRFHAISVTASMLHPGQRAHIESALDAPVYDTYRSAEVPWIAAECAARDGLHILADRRRVDIVDAEGNAAEGTAVGDVAVTDFDNRVFPLVRYAIGDRTNRVVGPCECGRSLDRVGALEGRIADVLRTPTGRRVYGGLSAVLNGWPGAIRQFQIVQSADFSVMIRYVAGPDPVRAQRAVAAAREEVANALANEVRVGAAEVDAIESAGGKARLVISSAPDA